MRRGDLSNNVAPRLLLDINTFVKYNNPNILDRVKNAIKGNVLNNYTLDPVRIGVIYRILKDSRYSITLYSDDFKLFEYHYNEEAILPCRCRYISSTDKLKELIFTVASYDVFVSDQDFSQWGTLPNHLIVLSFEDFLRVMGVK